MAELSEQQRFSRSLSVIFFFILGHNFNPEHVYGLYFMFTQQTVLAKTSVGATLSPKNKEV